MPDPDALILADAQVVADLRTFVGRARAADDGAMHFSASGTVLAAYVCLMRPRFLGEAVPTILGMRTMRLAAPAEMELTVSLGSVADRLARMAEDDVVLPLPPTRVTESWAGVLPPRSGWSRDGELSSVVLESTARNGAQQIAAAVPADAGRPVVEGLRSAVWGAPLEEPAAASETLAVPAGAAFAALALGFLDGQDVPVFASGRWLRLSTSRGHVLVRSGASL
ncbi:hypothetical protein LVY72_22540 [Arthrobacter sp. I2-34]|uniref:Uncharacterized protein n=1 Tax=Arthrobacter hankyongi TaxID=2904801 RepID=A0ABS9LD99_9MICC|nr:hypothetical protein [Arthrobacter hankyongi]MCG2624672.1 hypothetical protein [Arthrobacter hankyongi]